jgi:hypothetical protein
MRYRIHFTRNDGSDDSIDLEGETHEDIRRQADEAFALRALDDPQPWSEEII